MFRRPTFADVLRARRIVNQYLPRTPLLPSLSLSKLLGFQLYLKFENYQPIGAFKVRGGLNLVSSLATGSAPVGLLWPRPVIMGNRLPMPRRPLGFGR